MVLGAASVPLVSLPYASMRALYFVQIMQYNWLSTLWFAARNPAFVKAVVLVDPLLPQTLEQGLACAAEDKIVVGGGMCLVPCFVVPQLARRRLSWKPCERAVGPTVCECAGLREQTIDRFDMDRTIQEMLALRNDKVCSLCALLSAGDACALAVR